MEEDRVIITPEQFEEYKKITKCNEEILYLYSLVLKREAGQSIEEIATELGYTADEIVRQMSASFPYINLYTDTEEDVLNAIPEVYRDTVKSFREKALTLPLDSEEWEDAIDESIQTYEIGEIQNEQIDKIAEILSKSNLSQIPAEMWNDVTWTKKMHFENTGANIDMNNWVSFTGYGGSFIGCNLISYNITKYSDIFDFTMKSHPTDEEIEPSQRQVFIDAYRGSTFYPRLILNWLKKDENLFKNNTWIIDSIINNSENRSYSLDDIWSIVPDKYKIQYKSIFEQAIEKAKQPGKDEFKKTAFMLGESPVEIWDEYFSKIEEIYQEHKKNKELGELEYFEAIWHKVPKGVQEKYFDYFWNRYKDSEEKEKYYASLFNGLDKSFGGEKLGLIIDQYIDKNDYSVSSENSMALRNFFERITRKFDVPENTLNTLFNAYLNQQNSDFNAYTFGKIWKVFSPEIQEKYLNGIMAAPGYVGSKKEIWKNTDRDLRLKEFSRIAQFCRENNLKELEHYIQGEGYISLVYEFREDSEKIIQANMPQFLYSLREKYNCNGEDVDLSQDSKYNIEFAKLLMDWDKRGELSSENLNVIIENLPKLGMDVINRVIFSNSKMLSAYANKLIPQLAKLPREEAEKVITETEHVFSQRYLPDFIKIYKYYELISDNGLSKSVLNSKGKMSPVLENAPSEKMVKRVIFSDLMKIGMDSNNKSLRDFLNVLTEGNRIYLEYIRNNSDISSLSAEDRDKLDAYSKTLYALYENSSVASVDKKNNKKIFLTGDLQTDLKLISSKYANRPDVTNLPDLVLKTYIGPYQELYGGITTIDQMQQYMQRRINESNLRHMESAKQMPTLEPGDMVKGIGKHEELLQQLFSNGIRAGEFLGTDSHTDLTPLDTDFGIIRNDAGQTIGEKIGRTMASSYGSMYIVLKKDPRKVEFTRAEPELITTSQNSTANQMQNIRSKEELRRRIHTRSNGTYEPKRIEAFKTLSDEQYGVRTGLGITDVDYMVVKHWDKRIGYELAMNGTYIPVYDYNTQELVFSPEMYESIRKQMEGLSYFEAGEMKVDETAYSSQAQEIAKQLFTDGDVQTSTTQREAQIKRTAIERVVREVLEENFNMGMASKLTGDLTSGFAEFIDTGSTGRGTNLPGDGDFDFTMKIDNIIYKNAETYAEFREALRKKLAVRSDDPKSSIDETGEGHFRYKKIKIEGIEEPIDLDITFMQKDPDIEYSTDMAVRDRLETLKKSDPEGYKMTIANIVLAKKMLKEAGLYKKSNSQGATQYGGFGGVGVENWILQNGGSFPRAMQTFLEASEEYPEFDKFMEAYPIFDFGQNHKSQQYSHDSFVRGVTIAGFKEMQKKFKEMQEQLVTQNKTPNITLEEIGRSTLESFREHPEEEMRAGEIIEKGVHSKQVETQTQL